MAIDYEIEVHGELLRVTACGADENLEEVKNYELAILRAAVESGVRKVLCDERGLKYQISTIDTYELAEFAVENVPHLSRIAFVCSPEDFADASFFENTAVNRGLSIKAFTDVSSALRWLGIQPEAESKSDTAGIS